MPPPTNPNPTAFPLTLFYFAHCAFELTGVFFMNYPHLEPTMAKHVAVAPSYVKEYMSLYGNVAVLFGGMVGILALATGEYLNSWTPLLYILSFHSWVFLLGLPPLWEGKEFHLISTTMGQVGGHGLFLILTILVIVFCPPTRNGREGGGNIKVN
jgi:hypothetical protein